MLTDCVWLMIEYQLADNQCIRIGSLCKSE